tara:strand:+ start:1408 stop:1836 length:429 start_codon:yes stop_codon:yes gene_type:complete
MARITVEDCIDKFPSRFELVLVASNRARKLHAGENPTIEKDNDKNTVIALREIAEETLTVDQLKNDLIEEYQTTTFTEDEDLDETNENNDELSKDDNNLVEEAENVDNISFEKQNTDETTSDEELSPNDSMQESANETGQDI